MRYRRDHRIVLTLAVALLLGLSVPAGARQLPTTGPSLDRVRPATAAFHSILQVERAGYAEFLPCFDSPEGGMGQHYVNFELLADPAVDPLRPEAMVYELRGDRPFLVGVEYIVPGDAVDPENPPELFGEEFHLNAALGVWVLHAWVWRENPSGVFADYNPNVGACP